MAEKTMYEKQLEEAAARFELLKIFPETRRQFLEDGKLSYSWGPLAACYWFDDDDLKAIREFEKKNGALVYFAIRNEAITGRMDALFFVSKYPEEWEGDRADLQNGEAYCFVLNRLEPAFSDAGYIGFKLGPAAGLLRTY